MNAVKAMHSAPVLVDLCVPKDVDMVTALPLRPVSVTLDTVGIPAICIAPKVAGDCDAQKNVNANRPRVVMRSLDTAIVLLDIMAYGVPCNVPWAPLGTTAPTHVSAKTMQCVIMLRDNANASRDLLDHSVRKNANKAPMEKTVNRLVAARTELFAARPMELVSVLLAGLVQCVL